MTDNVVFLAGYKRKHVQSATSDCCCRPDYQCYPHRIAEAARILRVDLAASEGESRISRVRFAATVEAVLPVLKAIVAECLPDEREVN